MTDLEFNEENLYTTEGNQWLEGSYGFFGNTKDDIKYAVKNYGNYIRLKRVGEKAFQCSDDCTWYTYFYQVKDRNGNFIHLKEA